MLSILFLPLGGIKPWIDITLPEPIILSYFQLILFYFTLLLIDYILLSNERRIPMRAVQLRVTMAIVHATIPQFIVSNHVVANLFFAAMPWFMLTYCATLPLEHISIQEAYDSFMTIMIDQERLQKIDNGKEKKKITIHSARKETLKYGCTKILRGVIKWIFLFRCIEPLLPENNSYLLSLPWFSWKSMELTLLYGIKGYCFLGIVDIGMGIEEIVLGTPLVDLFDSPIISSSPRDFWSRRWNRAVRNLLHHVIFVRGNNNQRDPPDKKKQQLKRGEKAKSLRNLMGFLSFFVSGVFHELIIMSMFRKITLENLTFFTLHGVAVWIQLSVRDWATWSKEYPQGIIRVICVGSHLIFLSLTGRFFLAPFLRYYYPGATPSDFYPQ